MTFGVLFSPEFVGPAFRCVLVVTDVQPFMSALLAFKSSLVWDALARKALLSFVVPLGGIFGGVKVELGLAEFVNGLVMTVDELACGTNEYDDEDEWPSLLLLLPLFLRFEEFCMDELLSIAAANCDDRSISFVVSD